MLRQLCVVTGRRTRQPRVNRCHCGPLSQTLHWVALIIVGQLRHPLGLNGSNEMRLLYGVVTAHVELVVSTFGLVILLYPLLKRFVICYVVLRAVPFCACGRLDDRIFLVDRIHFIKGDFFVA